MIPAGELLLECPLRKLEQDPLFRRDVIFE